MLKLIAVLIAASVVGVGQKAVVAEPAAVGRAFLDALRTSDFERLDSVTTPQFGPKLRDFLLLDFKVLRDAKPCSESAAMTAVRLGFTELVDFGDRQMSREWLDLFGQLEKAYPCVARFVNSGGLSKSILGRLDGTATFDVYDIVVDADRPARAGGRNTERRVVSVLRVKTETFDSSWKVGSFHPLQ